MTMSTCTATVPQLTQEQVRARRLECAAWMRGLLIRVSKHFGLSVTDILEKDRHKHTVDARHVAMWIARKHEWSFPEIGRQFERDHTTVMNAVRRVENTPHLWAVAVELDGPPGLRRVEGEGVWLEESA